MTVWGSYAVEWGLLVTVPLSLCPVEGPVLSRVLSFAVIAAQKFDCQLFDISPIDFVLLIDEPIDVAGEGDKPFRQLNQFGFQDASVYLLPKLLMLVQQPWKLNSGGPHQWPRTRSDTRAAPVSTGRLVT